MRATPTLETETVRGLLHAATKQLQQTSDTPRLDAEVLLAHLLEVDRAWLITHDDQSLSVAQQATFETMLARRLAHEPIAYIIGQREFFALPFAVTPQVLIPRPETEHLIEAALNSQENQKEAKIHIVDVGTGSGCIAVTLAKHLPRSRVTAIDRSAAALAIARENATRHNVADQITFIEGDLLTPLSHPADMIVSNPPYVSTTELTATPPDVHRYEPHLALAGGVDGLAVIRRLLVQAQSRLAEDGLLLIEIGAAQGAAVLALARESFPAATCDILPDLAGLDRLLRVRLAG